MNDLKKYINISSDCEIQFKGDRNEIVKKDTGVFSFIGHGWNLITGTTKSKNIFLQMSRDIQSANEGETSFKTANRAMSIGNQVQKRVDALSKRSRFTKLLTGFDGIQKAARRVNDQAEIMLYNHWVGGTPSDEQKKLVREIYSTLAKKEPSEEELDRLDEDLLTLLGRESSDPGASHALLKFFKEKCEYGEHGRMHRERIEKQIETGLLEQASVDADDALPEAITAGVLPDHLLESSTLSITSTSFVNKEGEFIGIAEALNQSIPEEIPEEERLALIDHTFSALNNEKTIPEALESRQQQLDPGYSFLLLGDTDTNVEITLESSTAKAKITHLMREQLTAQDGEGFSPLPLFSITTVTTTVQEGKETKEIFHGEWQSMESLQEEVSAPSDSSAPSPEDFPFQERPGALQRLWSTNEHKLKREKYTKSLQTVRSAGEKAAKRVPKDRPTEQVIRNFTEVINKETGDIRADYRNSLFAFRELLEDERYKNHSDLHPFAEEIARARFQDNYMYEYCENLVESSMGVAAKEASQLPFEEQFRLIDNMNPSLMANAVAVNVGKLSGTLNVGFDPHAATNTPYANFSMQVGEREVKNLRFGTPTREGYWYSASVVPEFRAYLESLKGSGEKHLYINLQNRSEEKWIGSEKGRCNAIESLAEESELQETFFVATFAQDTPFYKQSGKYQEQGVAKEFKSEFKRQMFDDPKGGFHFSSNLKTGEMQEMLSSALDDVHAQFFGSREKLTVEERQAFIEIAYSLMTMKLIEISKAGNFNMSCKDAIDRGGKCNSLLFFLAGKLNGVEDTPEFKKEHMTITHAPALIVKKQAIIHGRKARLLQALNVVQKQNGGDAKTLQDTYQLSKPKVYRQESSTSQEG